MSDGVVNNNDIITYMGDNWLNQTFRGFSSFDLSGLPANAIIEDATLQLYMIVQEGTPFTELGGQIRVDHIDLGSTLDSGDYGSTPFAGGTNIGPISTAYAANTWHYLNSAALDSQVRYLVTNGYSNADFRYYFPTLTDGAADYDRVQAHTGEHALFGPKLTVKYRFNCNVTTTTVCVSTGFKWAYEDPSPGCWEFSTTFEFNGDTRPNSCIAPNYEIQTSSAAGEYYQGSSGTKIKWNHISTGTSGVAIGTKPDGSGVPPANAGEHNAGKNLSSATAMTFWIKSDSAAPATFKLELEDTAFAKKRELLLGNGNYVTVGTSWQQVIIPISAFPTTDPGFNIASVKYVNFVMRETDPAYTGTFYIDNVSFDVLMSCGTTTFTTPTTTTLCTFNWLLEDNTPPYGYWRYGYVYDNIAIGEIAEKSTGNTPPISTTEFYQGSTSAKLHFTHTTGSATIGFSTDADNSGTPPDNNTDNDVPKMLGSTANLIFWVKGDTASKAKIQLVNTGGTLSVAVTMSSYVTVDATWKQVTIPLAAFIGGGFVAGDLNALRYVQFSVDNTFAPGDWTFYVDNITFQVGSCP